MKDQYVGDVNDFAKYQLLRLAEAHFTRVLVAWMLTGHDGRRDGGQIGYLTNPDNGAADPELFEALVGLIAAETRSVAAVEASRALPGCEFHSTPMPRTSEERAGYFQTLAELADPHTLVFLDPDNGFEVRSAPMGSRSAERYLYWSELALLREIGSSVLVYQHFPRVQRLPYLTGLLARLRAEMGPEYVSFAAYTSRVGFLFSLRAEHEGLRKAVAERCECSPLLSFTD